MKSAYELAMERLEKASGPTRKLTDEQKAMMPKLMGEPFEFRRPEGQRRPGGERRGGDRPRRPRGVR